MEGSDAFGALCERGLSVPVHKGQQDHLHSSRGTRLLWLRSFCIGAGGVVTQSFPSRGQLLHQGAGVPTPNGTLASTLWVHLPKELCRAHPGHVRNFSNFVGLDPIFAEQKSSWAAFSMAKGDPHVRGPGQYRAHLF